MQKARILSDGTAKGTHVYNDDGHEINGIAEINIKFLPDKPAKMTITFVIAEVDVVAELDVIGE